MASTEIERRKSEHLKLVLEEDVSHSDTTLLEELRLLPCALPELNLEDLDLRTPFFSRQLDAPLMITSMTGGADYAEQLNRGLARVAGQTGIAFAVGSQRVMLRYPETISHFAVREQIGDGVLLGNIGAVQLLELPMPKIVSLAEQIEADGLCVHLNAGQELAQAEGNRHFAGITDAIARLVDAMDGRVLVKETGAGLDPASLRRLAAIGVRHVDVAGAGGTSWTRVEGLREANGDAASLGLRFADWGLPTAVSVAAARASLPEDSCIIASGGIRSGLDVARAIALGADLGGFARQALIAFDSGGEQGARALIETMKKELRMAMLLTGCRTPAELKRAPRWVGPRLKSWLDSLDDENDEQGVDA